MGGPLKLTTGLIVASVLQCFIAGAGAYVTSDYQNYTYESPQGYVLAVPQDFAYSGLSPSGEYYYFGYANTSIFGQTSIEFYDKMSSCTSSTTGASKTNELADTNGETVWGKVDAFDTPNPDFPPGTQPKCRPPILEWDYDEVLGVSRFSNDAAYALCAEKNGTTVLVCIEQVTDNPELAQQIFSSFRWVDDVNSPAIQYLLDNGIASGYPDGTFRPENPINRAEFTKIIVGATKEQQAIDMCLALSSVYPFPDVPVGEWFAPYVCTARQFGIVAGHPDGTFHPADNINTAEAAKIVVEAFDLYMPVEDGTANRSPWYQPYMQALEGIDALPYSAQEPSHLLTRGEMAEIVYGVMNEE